MKEGGDPAEFERRRLNLETGKISWAELQPHFARGRLIFVAAHLDLVEVALEFSRDNRGRIESWLSSEDLYPVSDDQARLWHTTQAVLWAVVVKPWVLVQPHTSSEMEV